MIMEGKKFLPYISEKSLSLLPIKIYRDKKAKRIIGEFALALRFIFPLWSNDERFHKVKEIALLKTKDLT